MGYKKMGDNYVYHIVFLQDDPEHTKIVFTESEALEIYAQYCKQLKGTIELRGVDEYGNVTTLLKR